MSVLSPLYTAIYNTLKAGTALISALGGTAIYNKQAPDNTAYPYVVFSLQGGGSENQNPSDLENSVVFVRCYADTDAKARDVDEKISALLHKATLTLTGGYTNFWSAREEDLDNVETPPNKKPVFMCGGLYRFRNDR